MRLRLGTALRVGLLVFVVLAPAAQAVVYGSVTTTADSSTSSTRTVSLPAGTAAGHLLLAHIAHNDGTGASITPPAGWSLRAAFNSTNGLGVAVFWKIAGASEPSTYTFTFSRNTKSGGAIVRYADVNTTSPFDGANGFAFSNATSLALPSITTTTANARIVTFSALVGSGTYTPASGMSERYDSGSAVTLQAADVALASAGASGAKTVTASASGRQAGVILALRTAPVPTVSLDRAASSEWESNGTVRYWANLSFASQLSVLVPYTIGGTATGGGVDHALASGTLTFAAGQTAKGINASIVNDGLAEANETLVITLGTPTNATLGAIGAATHTIVNEDTTVGFTANAVSLLEAQASPFVNVTLGTGTPRTVTVGYAAAAGTAASGADYALAAGTLTFPPWTTVRSLPLSVVGDTLDELDETFTLSLSAPTNALLGTAAQTATLVDDDAAPTVGFTAANSTTPEGGAPTYAIALSAASGLPITVSYATSAVTAGIPGDLASAAGTLAFAPGETSKSFSVALVQDALDEADETYSLALSGAANATLGVSTHLVTISDDDAAPTVRFASSASAGSEAAALPLPGVALSAASGLPVSVTVSVTGGTAAPDDHTGGAATLTFAPGQTSATVGVAAVNDVVQEGDETLILTLSAPSNATLGAPASHTLTILDDEAPVSIRFAQTEGSALEAAGAQSVAVVLSGPAQAPVTVSYALAGGTATADGDLLAPPGTLTFAPGETAKVLAFALVDDELVEADETALLTLFNATNATLGDATYTFTILNDDAPYPIVGFTSSGVQLGEAAASPAIEVTLSAPDTRVVTVQYALGGTATAGVDFALAPGTLTFSPGETSKSVSYAVADDATVEPDETLVLTLQAPTRATLGAATYTRVILNDDVVPPVASFALSASSASETSPSAALRVQLDKAGTTVVSVPYAVTASTATGDGIDYALQAGTLYFDVGETAKDVVVALSDDAVVEQAETVTVTLGTPTGATLGSPAAHVLSITSDDVAAITLAFAASSSYVSEGGGSLSLVVVASTVTTESYEVTYSAIGGNATAGSDYVLATGTLQFEPGETSKSFAVEIVGDTEYEGDETLVVGLSNPSFGVVGSPGIHVLTIQEDDPRPSSFYFYNASASAPEGSGSVSFMVVLWPTSAAAATVQYAATGGTATAGVDYTLTSGTLTFPPGETVRTITLTLLDDAVAEAGETVVLTLSNPSGALLGGSEHVFTIANDDATLPSVQWNLTASTASEGAGTATIRAYLSASAASSISVSYSVSGGTATGGGADYTLASGALTFAAGETSKAVTVTLVDDSAVEGDETVLLTLANPTGATLGATLTHTLTILENDAAASSLVSIAQHPVLADGSPHTGATWGGWSAEPGATNVPSTNYLKLVNSGTLANPSVVISFATAGFVGANDSAFVVPTGSNLQFAWWEDATPSSSAPNEGTFTFGSAPASPSVTVQFGGTGRVIYVAYRIVQMPHVMPAQAYAGSYTVTEL